MELGIAFLGSRTPFVDSLLVYFEFGFFFFKILH